jgi:molecular chaperone Hsp33
MAAASSKLAFTGIEFDILGRQELSFACHCDRERVIRALVSLGPDELQEIAAEDKPVELVCHFCGERYTFTPTEVAALIEPKPGDHLH